MTTWTDEELSRIGAAEELQLASTRPDGTLRPYVTMWVVRAGDDLYVREAGPNVHTSIDAAYHGKYSIWPQDRGHRHRPCGCSRDDQARATYLKGETRCRSAGLDTSVWK